MLELPATLARFVAELRSDGFVEVDEKYDPKAFGNGLLELARDPAERVRLLDRGLWSIEVAVAQTWQPPYLVILALDRTEYLRRALSHEEVVRYAKEALSRLRRDSEGQTALVDRIAALQRKAWNDRFGSPGDLPD